MLRGMRLVLWYLVKFCALICVLHFLGDIQWRASAVLTLFLVAALTEKSITPSAPFTAFTFTLHPQVGRMLIDLGYIDEDALKETKITDRSDPWSGAYLESFGVTGYAMQRSADGWPIVHWPELKSYTEGIGFHRQLEFMETSKNEFLSDAPGCFCRAAKNGGLAFGISVKDEWWKANSDAVTAKGIVIHVDRKYHFGTVDLTMAVLPRLLEHQFSGPQFITDSGTHKKQTQALMNELQEHGWCEESREYEESWMQSPLIYKHPYATVYMNRLHEIWN